MLCCPLLPLHKICFWDAHRQQACPSLLAGDCSAAARAQIQDGPPAVVGGGRQRALQVRHRLLTGVIQAGLSSWPVIWCQSGELTPAWHTADFSSRCAASLHQPCFVHTQEFACPFVAALCCRRKGGCCKQLFSFRLGTTDIFVFQQVRSAGRVVLMCSRCAARYG